MPPHQTIEHFGVHAEQIAVVDEEWTVSRGSLPRKTAELASIACGYGLKKFQLRALTHVDPHRRSRLAPQGFFELSGVRDSGIVMHRSHVIAVAFPSGKIALVAHELCRKRTGDNARQRRSAGSVSFLDGEFHAGPEAPEPKCTKSAGELNQ